MLWAKAKLHGPSNKGFCRGGKKMDPIGMFWTQAIKANTQAKGKYCSDKSRAAAEKNNRKQAKKT